MKTFENGIVLLDTCFYKNDIDLRSKIVSPPDDDRKGNKCFGRIKRSTIFRLPETLNGTQDWIQLISLHVLQLML